MLPYTYRVTKYDPADRDEHGHYTGSEDVNGDDGPVDAAYVDAAAAFAEDDLVEAVWEDEDGRITGILSDETLYAELAAQVTRSRAAAIVPTAVDDRPPLLTAVLPDNDGVLRARWRTDQTPADAGWAVLRAARRGQVRKCVVLRIAPFGVFVDLGGAEGLVRIPEMSWDRIDHPGEVVEVGQEITAVVIDVDLVCELVTLSMKALCEKPSTPPC